MLFYVLLSLFLKNYFTGVVCAGVVVVAAVGVVWVVAVVVSGRWTPRPERPMMSIKASPRVRTRMVALNGVKGVWICLSVDK